MSEPQPDDAPPPTLAAGPCRHLRSKGMYVYSDADPVANEGYDNSIFWCLRTMKSFGPDDEMVGREECCDGARSCHEEF
jgi:hypothetical protein